LPPGGVVSLVPASTAGPTTYGAPLPSVAEGCDAHPAIPRNAIEIRKRVNGPAMLPRECRAIDCQPVMMRLRVPWFEPLGAGKRASIHRGYTLSEWAACGDHLARSAGRGGPRMSPPSWR